MKSLACFCKGGHITLGAGREAGYGEDPSLPWVLLGISFPPGQITLPLEVRLGEEILAWPSKQILKKQFAFVLPP